MSSKRHRGSCMSPDPDPAASPSVQVDLGDVPVTNDLSIRSRAWSRQIRHLRGRRALLCLVEI